VTPLSIGEARSVQFPMVAHAAKIGWAPIAPAAPVEQRGSLDGMLFRDVVAAKLVEFNPWLPRDAALAIVETLEAIPPTVEGNREMLAWMRGDRQWHDEAEKRHRRITLVDFDRPGNNVLNVCMYLDKPMRDHVLLQAIARVNRPYVEPSRSPAISPPDRRRSRMPSSFMSCFTCGSRTTASCSRP
jgi:type I site-specific restriction-modification system R (restriction) subunit